MVRRTDQIRAAVIEALPGQSAEITRKIAESFGISRQAVSRHVKRLQVDGLIVAKGRTRARRLALKSDDREFAYGLPDCDEDSVWREDVLPLLSGLAANVVDLWHYAVTEMVNNAIDHSGGAVLWLTVSRNARNTNVTFFDNGMGIFNKICDALGLGVPEHAVLELAKGKFTTDPDNHSGEGIFFTSRAVDRFTIAASDIVATHDEGRDGDWVVGEGDGTKQGTLISLSLLNASTRQLDELWDKYADPEEDYVFSKTIVPVDLVRYGNERVVSRSQAKRLLSRLDRFNTVILDFRGIDSIGQAFADEVFRVFVRNHPMVQLRYANAAPPVEKMILRAARDTKEAT